MATTDVLIANPDKINITNLGSLTSSSEVCIKMLQNLGILSGCRTCSCARNMSFVKKTQCSDGMCWNCSTCRIQHSIRKDSIFYSSKLPLQTLVFVLFFFCTDVPAHTCHHLLKGLISYQAILEWYELYRNVCSKAMLQSHYMFSSEADINIEAVEIDESWFGKVAKNHRGTSRQTQMVFGIVARNGKHCLLQLVPTNSRSVLFPIIEKYVNRSCTIYHDGLSTYSNLHEHGYTHFEVNHSECFVTEDGIHTNTIEGLWGLCKQRIAHMHGLLSADRLASHLDEFCYRHSYGDLGNIWKVFLSDLAKHGNSIA